MSVPVKKAAEKFLNVVAATPVNCNWQLYDEEELVVIYGYYALTAVLDTDYTVDIDEEDYTFTVTPTAALIAKIDALIAADEEDVETNYITVRRQTDMLSSVTPENVKGVKLLAKEIERMWLAIQEADEKLARAVLLTPKEVGTNPTEVETLIAGRLLRVNEDGDGFDMGPELVDQQDPDLILAQVQQLADQVAADKATTVTAKNDALAAIAAGGIKVSANDSTPGVLNGKLAAGLGIVLTESNDGANEVLTAKVNAVQEADAAPASGTVTLDMNNGHYRKVSPSGNFTIDITPVTGKPGGYVLQLVNGGLYTITWTGVDDWANGAAPSLSSAGTDLIGFVADDDGVVRGYLIGTAFA